MAYDIFGVNGGSNSGTTAYKSNTAVKNAGKQYDVFNIGSVQAVANPNKQTTKAQPKVPTQPPTAQQKATTFLSKVGSVAKKAATGGAKLTGEAGRAIARPVIDVATGQGAKATHDAAQLTADTTGGAANYLLKTAIANPIKETAAQLSGNKKAEQNATQQSNVDLGLGKNGKDLKHGLIKTGAEAASAATNLVGGGEATALKTIIKEGGKQAIKRIGKDAAIGAAAGASNTLANDPGATKKDIAKNTAFGGIIGGAAPGLLQGASDITHGIAGKAGSADAKQLVEKQKVQTLMEAGKKPVAPLEYTPSNPKVKELVDANNRQQEAVDAPAKQAEQQRATVAKQTADTKVKSDKIDNQIELINAKKADGKFTNVDKVKVQQLQDEKTKLQAPSTVAGAATTPTETQIAKTAPVEAQPPETANVKPESVSSANSTPKNVISVDGKQHELSGDTLKEYTQIKSNYDRRVQTLNGMKDRQFAQKQLKAEGMKLAAEKRRLTGNLTPRERYAIVAKERSAYVGKKLELNVGGKSVKGEIAAKPAYGNVKVKLEDGSVISVKHGELPEDKRTDREILAPHVSKPGVKEYIPGQKKSPTLLEKQTKPKSKTTEKISNRKQTEIKAAGPEPITVPIKEPEIKQPDIGVPKLAQGVEANAIKKGLTQGFADKPEYAKVNIKQQSEAAANLVKTDPERAYRIAMGHEKAPEDLLPESVFIAVEHAATKTGNTELLRKLATESHLTSEATGMGQRIRMLGERDTNSAVSNIKKVSDARKAAFERKSKTTVAKATGDEIKQIRAAKPKVTKETWSSFVDSIKC